MKKEVTPVSVSSFKPLLTWASQIIATTITRPSQLTDGLCYYRLFCLAFPGRVQPNRIHHQPNNISEMNGNLRLLLEEMRKIDGKCRSINLQKLSKGIQQEHMAMLKWLKQRVEERQRTMEEPETQDEQNIQFGNVFIKPPKKIIKVSAPQKINTNLQKMGIPAKQPQKLSKQEELDENTLREIQEIITKERQQKAKSKIERIKKILKLEQSTKKTPNTQSMLMSLRQNDSVVQNVQKQRPYEFTRMTCPPRQSQSVRAHCNRQSLLIKTTLEEEMELEKQKKKRRSMNLLQCDPQNDL